MTWLYFTDLSEVSAKCNTCKTKLSIQGGSTSNLKKHMLCKHPHILTDATASASRPKAADNHGTVQEAEAVQPQSAGAAAQPTTSTSKSYAANSGKLQCPSYVGLINDS